MTEKQILANYRLQKEFCVETHVTYMITAGYIKLITKINRNEKIIYFSQKLIVIPWEIRLCTRHSLIKNEIFENN